MLAEREDEEARLEAQLRRAATAAPTVVPDPALVKRYEEKVAGPRDALRNETVRAEAADALRELIGGVTAHTDQGGRAVLNVEASTAKLIEFAQTTNAPWRERPGGVRWWWLRGQDLNL